MAKKTLSKPYKYWKNKLDAAMGALVREKGFCEWCGGRYLRLEWCHVVGRSNKTLRWDIINALSMDANCHKWKWHEHPLMAAEWFQERFPDRYRYLMKAKDVVLDWNEEMYKERLEAIKNKDFDKLHLDFKLLK